MTLYCVDWLLDLVQLSITASKLVKEDMKPCNIMIMAPPAHAKTEVMQYYSKDPSVVFVNDISEHMFHERYATDFQKKDKTVLEIADFITPMSLLKRRDKYITFCNMLGEEGISESTTMYRRNAVYNPSVKGTIITGITRERYNKWQSNFTGMGFLSRCIVVSYQYSNTTREKIEDSILGNYTQKRTYQKKHLKKSKAKIEVSKEHLRELRDIANSCNYRKEFYNKIRLWHRLVALAKASAFQNKRRKVIDKDVAKIKELSVFMNDRFTVV